MSTPNSTFASLLTAAVLLLSAGCVSTKILPQSGTIIRSLPFPDSEKMQVAHSPDGSLAVFRASTEEDGPTFLEGYDDTLGLRWRHTIEHSGSNRELIWLAHRSGKLVAVWQIGQPEFHVAVHASSHDWSSGQLLGSVAFGQSRHEEPGKYRNVISPRVLTSNDSSLLVSYSVDIPLGEREDFDSVRVHARLFDAEMNEAGSMTITLPIVPMHTTENYGYRLPGTPVVDSQGNLYLATVVGPETVRVHRIDIAGGSTSSIDIATVPAYPLDSRSWIQDLFLRLNESGKLMVAVSSFNYHSTKGVTLYQLDFRTRSLDFSQVIDFSREFGAREAWNLIDILRIRQILTSPIHGSMILLEDKATQAAPGRSYMGPSGMWRSAEIITIHQHRGVMLIRVDTAGATRWLATQDRPTLNLTDKSYVADMWRLDGDSLHYMTRNVLAGTVSVHDGRMSEPQQLLATDLEGKYRGSRWVDARRALLLLGNGSYNTIVDVRY